MDVSAVRLLVVYDKIRTYTSYVLGVKGLIKKKSPILELDKVLGIPFP